MDTSETYIKMCDCEEIQKGNEFVEGDIFYERLSQPQSGGYQAGVHFEYEDYTWGSHANDKTYTRERLVWLPRQDQLQAMVDGTGGFYHTLRELQGFAQSVINDIEGKHGNRGLNSMEQLWLAFVMSELYGKIWNGENWIRE